MYQILPLYKYLNFINLLSFVIYIVHAYIHVNVLYSIQGVYAVSVIKHFSPIYFLFLFVMCHLLNT